MGLYLGEKAHYPRAKMFVCQRLAAHCINRREDLLAHLRDRIVDFFPVRRWMYLYFSGLINNLLGGLSLRLLRLSSDIIASLFPR